MVALGDSLGNVFCAECLPRPIQRNSAGVHLNQVVSCCSLNAASLFSVLPPRDRFTGSMHHVDLPSSALHAMGRRPLKQHSSMLSLAPRGVDVVRPARLRPTDYAQADYRSHPLDVSLIPPMPGTLLDNSVSGPPKNCSCSVWLV